MPRAAGEPATRNALTRFIPASVPSALAGRWAPTSTTGWLTARVKFRKNAVSSRVAVPWVITKPAMAGSSCAMFVDQRAQFEPFGRADLGAADLAKRDRNRVGDEPGLRKPVEQCRGRVSFCPKSG